jgi:hypothetical protein
MSDRINELPTQRIYRIIGRVSIYPSLLRLTAEQSSQLLKTVEKMLLDSRKADLGRMSADLCFSLVFGFSHANIKDSELLYLIEPHILAKID